MYKNDEDAWYRGFLPKEIEISDTVLISVDTGIMEGCGVAIFKLTNKSIRLFSEKGLDALKSASHSREYRIDNGKFAKYIKYDKWKETPLPPQDQKSHESWRNGMLCAELENKLGTSIAKALQKNRSYYTDGIVVFPDLGLVMFSYGD